MQKKTISVIGLGYIGLPTAAMFAAHNVNVIGVDVSTKAVDAINRGSIHIVEPGLESVVKKAVNKGLLKAVLTPEPADAFLLAVPTPFNENHEPDLSYIKSAVDSISPVLTAGNIVILESTSPVGATEMMAKWIAKARPDLKIAGIEYDGEPNIHIAHCPERVLPGKVMEELITNDRIIGGMTAKCTAMAEQIYKVFVKGDCIATNCQTAEMAKLTENAFRDVNIAFANELSLICDKLNINVWELISLANRHPRVNILNPGPGVGGHCIAVDPWFIVHSAPDQAKLIKQARLTNDSKPDYVVSSVLNAVSHSEKSTVLCMGLAFKADIDDLRESPAVDIVEKLTEFDHLDLLVVEPNITELPVSLRNKVTLTTLDESISTADLLVVLVDHAEFKAISKHDLKGKPCIDTRGVFN